MEIETQAFRAVYKFFSAHASPPPLDSEASPAWWQATAADIRDLCLEWHDHPLMTGLLTAVVEYLEDKAKGANT